MADIDSNPKGHTGGILSLVANGNGSVFTGGRNFNIVEWSTKHSEVFCYARTFKGHKRKVLTLALAPEGHMIYSGSDDSTVRVWDISLAECIHTLTEHKSDILALAATEDFLASGSYDKTIKIWDTTNDFKCLATLSGHEYSVETLAFISDKILVSGSYDKTLKFWNLEDFSCTKTIEMEEEVYSLLVVNNGKELVVGSKSKLRIVDVESGEIIRTLENNLERGVHALTQYTPINMENEVYIVAGSINNSVQVYNSSFEKVLSLDRIKTVLWDIAVERVKIDEFDLHAKDDPVPEVNDVLFLGAGTNIMEYVNLTKRMK